MDKEKEEYNILVKFKYDDNDYVLYTDNTQDEDGNINVYGAKVDKNGKLSVAEDVDMERVFQIMIEKYRKKIVGGEL